MKGAKPFAAMLILPLHRAKVVKGADCQQILQKVMKRACVNMSDETTEFSKVIPRSSCSVRFGCRIFVE